MDSASASASSFDARSRWNASRCAVRWPTPGRRVSCATRLSTAGENTADSVGYAPNPTKEDPQMAVVSMMRVSGDPDELAAKISEHLAPVGRELGPQHGGLGNIVCRTGDGLMIINLWENEQGRHDMAQEPRIQEAVQAAGPPEPAFEGYEVVAMSILPEAV